MLSALSLLQHCSRLIPKHHCTPIRTRQVSIFNKYRGQTFNTPIRRSTVQMEFPDGPLVWIDCEMTGLDFRTDKLLEIAVIITNGNLEPVDEGVAYVIRTEKDVLDGMNSWCIKQHGKSGLTQACLDSPNSMEEVSKAVLQYVRKWIPIHRIGVLAGNSVHVDRTFLGEAMPELLDWLHYRIVDVSSIKELTRRWYGKDGIAVKPFDKSTHRALDDIRASIKELQWYREKFFIPPRSNQSAEIETSVEPSS